MSGPFKKKQMSTLATRRRTKERHEQHGHQDKPNKEYKRAPKTTFTDEELRRAAAPLPPDCAQEIRSVNEANDKKQDLIGYLRQLRAAEKGVRQKLRVLVFVNSAKTARELEKATGLMVAKKTATRGHQRRCGNAQGGNGAATRTAYENKDVATLQDGMQLGYTKQLAQEFRSGKINTIFALDSAVSELKKQCDGIGLVISFDRPKDLRAYRLRASFAGKEGSRSLVYFSNTVAERAPDMHPMYTWMVDGGAVLPPHLKVCIEEAAHCVTSSGEDEDEDEVEDEDEDLGQAASGDEGEESLTPMPWTEQGAPATNTPAVYPVEARRVRGIATGIERRAHGHQGKRKRKRKGGITVVEL